ncbi:unnamed protein product [Brassica oleracea var. botrytis]
MDNLFHYCPSNSGSISSVPSEANFYLTRKVSASAAAVASMRTVVVRFADADAAAAATAYYIATADFIGVSRRTRRRTQFPASTKRTRVDAEC